MGLEYAHKGYEYQDLLSALFIIEQLLVTNNAIFKIDKKESKNDKFDDITIISDNGIFKRQIKYSENKILQKADFSTASYDLALDTLFKSWKETVGPKTVDYRICLAWEYVEDSKELDFLEEVDCYNLYEDKNVRFLKINIDKIWKSGELPIPTWRRLRSKANNINREEFAAFLNNLIIEVNLPKASHDLSNPDVLERLVISKLKKFGVGKYPNHSKEVNDILLNLTHIIKSSRANGEELNLNTIVFRLGLRSDFGNIKQSIDIDKDINVVNESRCQDFYEFIITNQKTLLLGEPGSGKSWFIQNFIKSLESHSVKVVEHYCYTGVDDIYEKDRITVNVFLANLINDIISAFPNLAEYKSTKFGVDVEELQTLLNNIQEEVVIIIDGLDHIGRVYNFHKSIIKEVDTEIIKVISELVFPENVRVILASQPIKDVIKLTDDDYKIYNVEAWDISDIDRLLINNNLEDINLDWNLRLSELLMKKSNGNPLYLTYLINEIKRFSPAVISVDLIESFPPYSNNLSDYYDYIMSKIPESEKIPLILSGAPFYLTEEELIEITGLGQIVEQSLDEIQSILKFNVCNGGYTIYHESFRRYIVESLEKKEVNVEIAIYKDLIEWLKNKGFYENRKSYLNLLVLLFESKRYEEILAYCNKEFVVDSIFYGNNINSLKRNFEILMKTACIQKDYGSLIVCTELSNMIYSLEYSFDENSELYYWGLGLIHGFDTLRNTLFYEGKMALDLDNGIKVCYLCSINNIIPEWEPYIELLIESKKSNLRSRSILENELEDYRYYICACLDMGWKMADILSNICDKKAFEYRKIVIEEYNRRNLLDNLIEIIRELPNNQYWEESISDFLGNRSTTDESYITSALEELKVSNSYSEETMSSLRFYVDNIEYIIEHQQCELNGFIDEIKDRNWYYNWLIFIAEVNKVILEKDSNNNDFESNLCDAYLWLIKDVAPFKGTPRTCDLYNFESIIYETIKSPMAYVKTKDAWERIIEIVKMMSEETMTTFRGSTGGPLPTYKLFNLFLEIANEQNNEVIMNIFNEKISNEDKYRLYYYLADYSFKHSIFLFKARKEDEAQQQFREGVKYLLSYSFRKDRTLSHLLDSVESTYMVNNEKGLQNILRLKTLADAVVYHTDGRSTKTYQREWFEILVNTDMSIALAYLKNELTSYVAHWIFEDSLEYLLISCNGEISPRIENVLFKTFPNNTSDRFIEAYVNNIEWLIENNFLPQARRSIAELVSRFGIEGKVHIYNYRLAQRLRKLCEMFNIDWYDSIYSNIGNIKSRNYSTNNQMQNNLLSRLSFDKLTNEDLLLYIRENGIRNGDLQGLYYYLSKIKDLNDESKVFLSSLIKNCFDRMSDDSTKKKLIYIFDNLELSNKIKAFIYMHMFLVHTDGWYNRFTETDLFRRAHEYDSQVAEKHFFEYIYNNFYTVDYSLSVGGQIINSLTAVDNENEDILDYWDKLFDIINYRLPGQIDFDWSHIITKANQFENEEKLISILLTRLKYGEANRYRWIISELDNLLKDEYIREKFAKPFILFLSEREEYIDYSLIVLLVLIRDHFTNDEIEKFGIKDSLKGINSSGNVLIDYLIRVILNMNKNRIYLNYSHKYKYDDDMTNYCIDQIKKVDSRLSLLEMRGVDIGNIIHNYVQHIFSAEFLKKYSEILFDGKYSTVVPNVYYYDILTKYMANEIDEFINNYSGHEYLNEIEEELFSIVLDDIRLIVAQNNSIIPRPKNLKLPEYVDDHISEVELSDWIRIAYYEKWFYNFGEYKENFGENLKTVTIFSGIGFNDRNVTIPFYSLIDEYTLFDENYVKYILLSNLTKFEYFLTSNATLHEDPYLTYKVRQYLGISSVVLYLLEIKIIEDYNGIVGITKDGEIVLKFSRWDVSFHDSDSDADRIPYLIGSQLLMKKSKFLELCTLFRKKPYLYTNKIDLYKND